MFVSYVELKKIWESEYKVKMLVFLQESLLEFLGVLDAALAYVDGGILRLMNFSFGQSLARIS